MAFSFSHSGLLPSEEMQEGLNTGNSFSFPVLDIYPFTYPLSEQDIGIEQFPIFQTTPSIPLSEWPHYNGDINDNTWVNFLCDEEEAEAETEAEAEAKAKASNSNYTTSTSNFSTPEISSMCSCVSTSSVALVQGNVLEQPSSLYLEQKPGWTNEITCNSSAGTTTHDCNCSDEVSSSQQLPQVIPEDTWTEESCSESQVFIFHVTCDDPSLGDGFVWRKYGQKNIKGKRFPRSYFRCANSSCSAKKQTESCSEKEGVVLIKYIGKHNHAT